MNFLFVLSLYARDNTAQKAEWKEKVRNKFRKEIQEWLQKDYDFYAIKAHPDVNGEEYVKKHFKQLLGKVYTPFMDNTVYSLALDTTNQENKTENEYLLKELQKYFYIAECKLGEQPKQALQKTISKGFSPIAEIKKDGVLMVMMENYDIKCMKFIPTGKLAIGIKYTKDSMKIVEHLSSIGYVLFHHRNNTTGQHLFAIKGVCKVISSEDVEPDRYKNVTTTEMYLSINIDTSIELHTSNIDSTKKEWTKATRYDAQYAVINDLLIAQ